MQSVYCSYISCIFLYFCKAPVTSYIFAHFLYFPVFFNSDEVPKRIEEYSAAMEKPQSLKEPDHED